MRTSPLQEAVVARQPASLLSGRRQRCVQAQLCAQAAHLGLQLATSASSASTRACRAGWAGAALAAWLAASAATSTGPHRSCAQRGSRAPGALGST